MSDVSETKLTPYRATPCCNRPFRNGDVVGDAGTIGASPESAMASR